MPYVKGVEEMNTDMSRTNVAYLAKNRGFTEVQTASGWVSLDEWEPYGKLAGHKAIGFTLDEEGKAIDEWANDHFKTYEGMLMGRWPIR
jgi:hypothetical protein